MRDGRALAQRFGRWPDSELCQTQVMTTNEKMPPDQARDNAGLQVIEGGREHIERAALDAVFAAPQKLPALLKQLARPEGLRLGLVERDDAGA